MAAATAIWRERCGAILRRLSDLPVVRPDAAGHCCRPLGLSPAAVSRRLFDRAKVAAKPMDGWGPSGAHYLRLVFANEPVERLGDLTERFRRAP